MPPFIHVKCPCGREVRAKFEQVGTTTRCWSCGQVVPIPVPTANVGPAFVTAFRDAFRTGVIVPILVGALLILAALHVPYAGPLLALALLTAGAGYYQGAAADASDLRPRRFWSNDLENGDGDAAADDPWRDLRRAVLGFVGAVALVAPLLIRNGGRLAPGWRGSFWGMLAALVGWIVVPLLLAAANARDRHGRIAPKAAAREFARHPTATIFALAWLPLGLFAIEMVLAGLIMEQGALTHSLCDVLLPPELEHKQIDNRTRSTLIFHFDNSNVRCPYFSENGEDLVVYRAAVRHGYWFVSGLPLSLACNSLQTEFDPSFFQMSPMGFWLLRMVLATIALTGAGLVLSIQSRWLGLIAALAAPLRMSVAAPSDRREVAAANGLGSVNAVPPSPMPAYASPALPLAPTSQAAVAVAPAPAVFHDVAVALTGPPGARTILIIDDERAFAHALGKILVGRGFTVLLAADAAEGHQLALSARPDLIVLDLLLPDRPGMDLCRELRVDARTSNVPIIIATYKTGADDEVAGLSQGADDYIAKPYVVEVLIARIQKQLRVRRT
jgi:CheY-like chemotaxis protein